MIPSASGATLKSTTTAAIARVLVWYVATIDIASLSKICSAKHVNYRTPVGSEGSKERINNNA